MTKRCIAVLVVVCFLFVTSIPVGAHSGGTDRHGCHAGTQPYHCHNAKDDGKKAGEIALIVLGVVAVLWIFGRLVKKPMPHADLRDIQDGDGKLSWKWRF